MPFIASPAASMMLAIVMSAGHAGRFWRRPVRIAMTATSAPSQPCDESAARPARPPACPPPPACGGPRAAIIKKRHRRPKRSSADIGEAALSSNKIFTHHRQASNRIDDRPDRRPMTDCFTPINVGPFCGASANMLLKILRIVGRINKVASILLGLMPPSICAGRAYSQPLAIVTAIGIGSQSTAIYTRAFIISATMRNGVGDAHAFTASADGRSQD